MNTALAVRTVAWTSLPTRFSKRKGLHQLLCRPNHVSQSSGYPSPRYFSSGESDDEDGVMQTTKSYEQQMLEALQEQNSILKNLLEKMDKIERKMQGQYQTGNPKKKSANDVPWDPLRQTHRSGYWWFQQPHAIRQREEERGIERIRKYLEQKVAIESKMKTQKGNPKAMAALAKGLEGLQAKYMPGGEEDLDLKEEDGIYSESLGLIRKDGQVLKGAVYPEWVQKIMASTRSAPAWSSKAKQSVRHLLPQIAFNEDLQIKQKSGFYSLVARYNNDNPHCSQGPNASIIIGEVEFSSTGMALANGADWDRLLANQRQLQLPYAHGARGLPKWKNRKVTEPWEDGDKLRFGLNTNTNTLTFQRNDLPEQKLQNILAFTNSPLYPEDIRAFAYCGGVENNRGSIPSNVKLTIIPL